MSFYACVDFAVTVHIFHNIAVKPGRHICAQFTLYFIDENSNYHYAIPYSLSEFSSLQKPLRSAIIDNEYNYYSTKLIRVKQQEQIVNIKEICNFRLVIDDRYSLDTTSMQILCGLYHLERDQLIQVDETIIKTNKISQINTYLPAIFNDSQFACTFDVNLYSQLTGFKFYFDQLEFLKENSNHRKSSSCMGLYPQQKYSNLENYITQYTNNFSQNLMIKFQQQHLNLMKHSLNRLKQQASYESEGNFKEQEDITTKNQTFRSRIFSESKPKSIQSNIQKWIANINIQMNNISGMIYELWNKKIKDKLNFHDADFLKGLFYDSLKKFYHQFINPGEKIDYIVQDLLMKNPRMAMLEKKQINMKLDLSEIREQISDDYIEDLEKIRTHIVVMVHGYNASRFAFELFKFTFKRLFPNIKLFISSCNQMRTDDHIQQMGRRLSDQVKSYLKTEKLQYYQLSFIGHSLGGIIIRAALPYFSNLRKHMRNLITIATPHLGYLFHENYLVRTGLWFLNKINKSTSMVMLNMADKPVLRDTYLYNLSHSDGLNWFKQILFVSSPQDSYVSEHSAFMVKPEVCLKQLKQLDNQAQVCSQIVDNLYSKLDSSKISRIQCNFNQLNSSLLDRLVGRTAHVKYLISEEFVYLLLLPNARLFT